MSDRPKQHLVIQPPRSWSPVNFRELVEFRDLFVRLAIRDITLRYRQTALGVIWVVLQPVLGAGILSFVFGRVAGLDSAGVPYFVFAFAGLLAWNAVSSTVAKATPSLVQNQSMVSKVFFPKMLLPAAVVGSTLLDFVVSMTVMGGVLVAIGRSPGMGILLLPLWLLFLLLFATGLSLLTSSAAVRYRDVQYVVPVAIQMLLFASPVAYNLRAVPESVRNIFLLNPLSELLEAFRWSLVRQGDLSVGWLAYSATFSLVVFGLGAAVFARMERQFADVI